MKAIRTTYHGPTNMRGSRVSATDDDGNRVSVPYDHALNAGQVHAKAARALCEKMGWDGTLIQGGLGNGYVFVWETDERVYVRKGAA